MQPIKSLLPRSLPTTALHSGRSKDQRGGGEKRKKGANSERAQLIGFFTDEISRERKGTKYRPVTYRYIGVKLAHLSVFDLHYLKRTLEDYAVRRNSFAKGFFGSLKIKRCIDAN